MTIAGFFSDMMAFLGEMGGGTDWLVGDRKCACWQLGQQQSIRLSHCLRCRLGFGTGIAIAGRRSRCRGLVHGGSSRESVREFFLLGRRVAIERPRGRLSCVRHHNVRHHTE